MTVSSFWIDITPVTNRQFRQFIDATRHIAVAKQSPIPKDYPGALSHMLDPGSLAFTPPRHRVARQDWTLWCLDFGMSHLGFCCAVRA